MSEDTPLSEDTGSDPSVRSYLIIIPEANRVDPDQADLTRELPDLGVLCLQVLKDVSMR